MSSLYKKLVALLVMCMVVLGMSVPAFAAEPAAANSSLTHAKFVKENGNDLAMGMGDGVIAGTAMDEVGNITITLQEYKRWFLKDYKGSIQHAYLVENDGTYNENADLVSTVNGVSYLNLNKSDLTKINNTTIKGVHLRLVFKMEPSTPPGMKSTMNAFFTCDEFQNM